ncbi:MAG: hypothetical protein LBT84_06140, partial [Spirochaetia bacterium]|nr:hypothetical protein [Spirochaetia bacterium]
MYLFVIILVNVFMGALLYLVISIKLERSASDFRQQRLRKEMDEMLKEFNAAAERNISLLENRIQTARKLLEQSGALKGLDILADDEAPLPEQLPAAVTDKPQDPPGAEPSAVTVKQSLLALKTALAGGISRKRRNAIARLAEKYGAYEPHTPEAPAELITRDLNSPAVQKTRSLNFEETAEKEHAAETPFDDEKLAALFSSPGDMYALIAHLAGEGCSL